MNVRVWKSHRDWRWTVTNGGGALIRSGAAKTEKHARRHAQEAAAQEQHTEMSTDGMTILRPAPSTREDL